LLPVETSPSTILQATDRFNADWLIVCSTRDKESHDDRLRIMKKLFAALTVLGIVLGTATLATTPANAAILSFGYQGDNQGAGS
jgi:hypothetical protein